MPCPICLENMTCSVVIELDCAHIIHKDCLIQLIESRHRKCPMCREPIRYTVPQLKKLNYKIVYKKNKFKF